MPRQVWRRLLRLVAAHCCISSRSFHRRRGKFFLVSVHTAVVFRRLVTNDDRFYFSFVSGEFGLVPPPLGQLRRSIVTNWAARWPSFHPSICHLGAGLFSPSAEERRSRICPRQIYCDVSWVVVLVGPLVFLWGQQNLCTKFENLVTHKYSPFYLRELQGIVRGARSGRTSLVLGAANSSNYNATARRGYNVWPVLVSTQSTSLSGSPLSLLPEGIFILLRNPFQKSLLCETGRCASWQVPNPRTPYFWFSLQCAFD